MSERGLNTPKAKSERGIFKKHLQYALVSAKKIKGFEPFGEECAFLNIICPICSNRIQFPLHHAIKQLGKMVSIERNVKIPEDLSRFYGNFFEEYFIKSWNLLLFDRFGELEDYRFHDPYKSLPDFHNKTLKTWFELKAKVALDLEDIEKRFEGKEWLPTTSVMKKFEHQQNNPDELYIFVVYFLDSGYKVLECSKAYEHLKNNLVFVPLKEFISFKQFLKRRVEKLGL